VDRADQDVMDQFDWAWGRFSSRMRGLGDGEWAWHPVSADPRISIRWRVDHIAQTLSEDRNWLWLGVAPPAGAVPLGPAASAAQAITAASSAYARLRGVITSDEVDLAEAIGPVGGPYHHSSRRSFVLHLADELIHHAAEAALLRDIYAGWT
jgi:hypothetical protein